MPRLLLDPFRLALHRMLWKSSGSVGVMYNYVHVHDYCMIVQ